MANLYLGRSFVSLIAATSVLLPRRKSSSSAFLSATDLAFHASIRKLRVMVATRGSQLPCQLPPLVWLSGRSNLEVGVLTSAAGYIICGGQTWLEWTS
jgi:hypothetical protein